MIGLRTVEKRTSPKLSAKLPLEFCAQAVDAPAIGMAATKASPTRMSCASSGLCQSYRRRPTQKIKTIGIRRLAASPAANTHTFCTRDFK